MPKIRVQSSVPKGKLVSYFRIDESYTPMEVELGTHGKYRIFELYCTNPRCECETAHLYLQKLEARDLISLELNLKEFTTKLKSHDENYQKVSEAFAKSLSALQKATFLSHYKRAKEFGEDDPTSYLDFSSFEFGTFLTYDAVFGREKEETFGFTHAGKRYSIEDAYCVDPSCNCEVVALTVYEVDPSSAQQEPTFFFQVKFDGRYWTKPRREGDAQKFFDETIKENVALFSLLMKRYKRMKELGKIILRRYWRKKKSQVTFTSSGGHVPRRGKELVERMISKGLMVSGELVKELTENWEIVTPSLMEVLEEEEYWSPNGPGGGWGPIHAIHLFGAFGTEECFQSLTKVIREKSSELGDWLTEDMPSILANFGPSAKEPLMKLILDRELDMFSRHVAARALAAIAHKHAEIRAEVIALLLKIVMGEENPEFRGLIISDLAQFKDPGVLAEIKPLFKQRLIDEFVIRWEDVERIYNTPEWRLNYHRDLRDPLDHFLPQNLRRLWNVVYGDKAAHFIDAEKKLVHQEKPKKVGRNDPCPCGSGKKYKKCCLLKERGIGT